MIARMHPSTLRGTVRAPSSKSAAHRVLICAALSREPSRIALADISEDIGATIRCLAALGAAFHREGDVLWVRPVWNNLPSKASLHCGESGSTLRFLLPIAAALGVEVCFQGGGRLPARPNDALLSCLAGNGAAVAGEGLPITISGKLRGGEYALPGDVSSQYLTGLLLALPHLPSSSRIRLTSCLSSAGYVDMTLDVLNRFGIAVRQEGDLFHLPAPQKGSGGSHAVEGDWSAAAFWLAANALGADVRVEGLERNSLQGDRGLIDILARFQEIDGGLRGIRIDAGDVPDLVPILAVVATQAKGTTRIVNAARLRMKESDRLEAMAKNLQALGANIQTTPDGLSIEGPAALTGGETDAFGDHRIAMAIAVATMVAQGPVRLHGADSVGKSYPAFWQDYRALGGRMETVEEGMR